MLRLLEIRLRRKVKRGQTAGYWSDTGDKEKERDKEGIKEAEVAGDDWEDEDRVKIDRDLADSG